MEKKHCVICIDCIEDKDTLYFLPCLHFFHEKCIAIWLRRNIYCPLCRIPIFIETVEQLSQYEEYAKAQKTDESVRLANLGNDLNSIAYRFMRLHGIRNYFRYDDGARRREFYEALLGNDDVDSKEEANRDVGYIIDDEIDDETDNEIDGMEEVQLGMPLYSPSLRRIQAGHRVVQSRTLSAPSRTSSVPRILPIRPVSPVPRLENSNNVITEETLNSLFPQSNLNIDLNSHDNFLRDFTRPDDILNRGSVVQFYDSRRLTLDSLLDMDFTSNINYDRPNTILQTIQNNLYDTDSSEQSDQSEQSEQNS